MLIHFWDALNKATKPWEGGTMGTGTSAGTYSATAPTLADGDQAGFTFDERSRLRTTSGPATEHATVTPADTGTFALGTARGIFVGGAGTVTAVVNGVAVQYTVPAGTSLPIRATRINTTGTSATLMVAWF